MASALDYLKRFTTILSESSYPNVYIECPSCGTHAAKFAFNVSKGVGHCFRASCDWRCNFPQLISKVERVPIYEAFSRAKEYADGLEFEIKTRLATPLIGYPKNATPLTELALKEDLTIAEATMLSAGVEYLACKRKLTIEQIESYQLGVGIADFLVGEKTVPRYGMLVLPIHLNGEIVSYTQRQIDGFNRKQKHYSATVEEGYIPKGQLLFNCDAGFSTENLVIVEDPWSAIKMNAVALLGSSISDEQLYIIRSNYRGRITLLMDGDEPGRKAAKKIAIKLLHYFNDVLIATLPEGVDPDDNPLLATEALCAAAKVTLFDLQLNSTLRN